MEVKKFHFICIIRYHRFKICNVAVQQAKSEAFKAKQGHLLA